MSDIENIENVETVDNIISIEDWKNGIRRETKTPEEVVKKEEHVATYGVSEEAILKRTKEIYAELLEDKDSTERLVDIHMNQAIRTLFMHIIHNKAIEKMLGARFSEIQNSLSSLLAFNMALTEYVKKHKNLDSLIEELQKISKNGDDI